MSYGPYNAGGSAAYDVESLVSQIMDGELSTSLNTADDVAIQTTDAKNILAVRRI